MITDSRRIAGPEIEVSFVTIIRSELTETEFRLYGESRN